MSVQHLGQTQGELNKASIWRFLACLGRNSNDENYDESVAKMKAAEEALEAKRKQQPSFGLSGKLAAEINRVRGITLLFTEPSDAKKPNVRWQLYVFKGGEALNEPLYIHRQSCYLFGRERRVGRYSSRPSILQEATCCYSISVDLKLVVQFFFFAVSGHFSDFLFLVDTGSYYYLRKYRDCNFNFRICKR